MGLFRRGARDDDNEPTSQPALDGSPMDLARFDRLLEVSVRLRDLGIDYETIERRAAADDISWNAALEAIDRERSDA